MSPEKVKGQHLIAGVLLVCVGFVTASYLDALDDTILHKINWAGPLPDELPVSR
jgi:hypothetical protein